MACMVDEWRDAWRRLCPDITDVELDELGELEAHGPQRPRWMLAAYRRGRTRGFAEAALHLVPEEYATRGCGRDGCPCGTPHWVCPQFEGGPGALHCPCCGWSRRMHEQVAARRARAGAGVSS